MLAILITKIWHKVMQWTSIKLHQKSLNAMKVSILALLASFAIAVSQRQSRTVSLGDESGMPVEVSIEQQVNAKHSSSGPQGMGQDQGCSEDMMSNQGQDQGDISGCSQTQDLQMPDEQYSQDMQQNQEQPQFQNLNQIQAPRSRRFGCPCAGEQQPTTMRCICGSAGMPSTTPLQSLNEFGYQGQPNPIQADFINGPNFVNSPGIGLGSQGCINTVPLNPGVGPCVGLNSVSRAPLVGAGLGYASGLAC